MITVYFYAGLREKAKVTRLSLASTPSMTVKLLRELISRELPEVASLLERSSIAVNDVMVTNDDVLPAECDIALLPPVSGG